MFLFQCPLLECPDLSITAIMTAAVAVVAAVKELDAEDCCLVNRVDAVEGMDAAAAALL